MTTRRRLAMTALVLAAAATPGAVAAQTCGLIGGAGLAASAGVASYEIADGVSGAAYGLDGAVALSDASIRAGYRRVELKGPPSHIGRLAAAVPLPVARLGGLRFCGTGHAGAARLPVGDEGSTVAAGGAGLRIAIGFPLGAGEAIPYAEVRGLAARSSGTILGVDVDATGLALGVEGGVQAAVGSVTLRLSAAVDGFAEGLGVTPYPSTSLEAALGVRF